MAEAEAVLRPGSEHPVGLVGPEGHEIVDENTYVGLVPSEDKGLPACEAVRGVDPREESLPRRLFVSGGSVGLSGNEQPLDELALQIGIQLPRIDVIIFHGVSRTHDHHFLEAVDGVQELVLHLLRKGRGYPVQVHLLGIQPLRLDKNLMPCPVGEPDNFVLDRRTVPGPHPPYDSAVEGGTVDVVLDNLVCPLVGIGDVAGNARPVYLRTPEGKGYHRGIPRLLLENGEVNRGS